MTRREKKAAKNGESKAPEEKSKTCFCIFPFSKWHTDYYKKIYCPAIKEAGLEPRKSDDIYRSGTIINDIWAYTQNAEVLLADLTGKNPNVLYELGLAHAIAKPAILIAESMDDVPFDLRSLRIIEFDKNDPDWGDTLKEAIAAAIKETLASPKTTILPTFLSVSETERPSVTATEKEIMEIKGDLMALKKEVRSGVISPLRETFERNEAENLLRAYLRRGMPKNLIIERLVSRGAPRLWVEDRLEVLED